QLLTFFIHAQLFVALRAHVQSAARIKAAVVEELPARGRPALHEIAVPRALTQRANVQPLAFVVVVRQIAARDLRTQPLQLPRDGVPVLHPLAPGTGQRNADGIVISADTHLADLLAVAIN